MTTTIKGTETLDKKHAEQALLRKRGFSTIMETMEDAVVSLRAHVAKRRKIVVDPEADSDAAECESYFHNISKSMANILCLYKENEYLHEVVCQMKARDLRTKAMLNSMQKKSETLYKSLDETRQQELRTKMDLEVAQSKAQLCEGQMRDMRESVEHMRANERMYNEMLLKQKQ
jgi:hypothetical protein